MMLKEQIKKEKKNAKWMWLTRTSNKRLEYKQKYLFQI